MRRWFWALLFLSAVALAVAFVVFPIGGGGNDGRSYAHIVPTRRGLPARRRPTLRSTWTSQTAVAPATRWIPPVT